MSTHVTCPAEKALEKLKTGNAHYRNASRSEGDISPARREKTCAEGQSPYAVIVTCSDSRVMPESIFGAGIGDLFVIRVAGNVVGSHELGSIEYAAEHLGCRLILVMGHNHCGAISAAIRPKPEGYIKFITDEIREAIGDETDNYKACCLNVQHAVDIIRKKLEILQEEKDGLHVCGALYRLEDGRVDFL